MYRAVTIRIPEDLHLKCKKAARSEKVSLNSFLLEGARKMIGEAQRRNLYDAFSEAAVDADVSYAFDSQKEIVDNG